SLPTEDSDHGRHLEAQAQSVEVSTMRSESPLVLARKPDASAIAETAADLAVQRVASERSAPPQFASATTQYIQRAEGDTAPSTSTSSAASTGGSTGGSVPQPSGGGGGENPSNNSADPLTGLPAGDSQEQTDPLKPGQLHQAWTYVRSRLR